MAFPLCQYGRVMSARVRELKTLLDQLVKRVGEDDDAEFTAGEETLRREAVGHFIAGGEMLLEEATPFLWAYYRTTAGEFTVEERKDYGVSQISDSVDIWEHVHFYSAPTWRPGGGPLEPGQSYLSFEGEVSWEREHGLQLVFERGQHVCKVGPYDGHLTNAHAFGDAALLGTVFVR